MFKQVLKKNITSLRFRSTFVPKRTKSNLTWRYPRGVANFPQDIFDHDWFAETDASISDYFKTKETPKDYILTIKEPHAQNKDVSVHFCKPDNALLVTISQNLDEKGKDTESRFASAFTNKYTFDKPVESQEIKADHDAKNGEIIITVPKKNEDDDSIVNVPFNNKNE